MQATLDIPIAIDIEQTISIDENANPSEVPPIEIRADLTTSMQRNNMEEYEDDKQEKRDEENDEEENEFEDFDTSSDDEMDCDSCINFSIVNELVLVICYFWIHEFCI
ncbi:hypothetical protein CDL12_15708 [Handroanthus impetiginosus]|uniref:Uncharacterized protein n=1 Tax=Handroanthus impetiginosus TaxID=429701 RepID=A0A2G9H2E4_9LAMI|nr:hypothetical protein CDL12_15708 [Handroanthus impetiginosus]